MSNKPMHLELFSSSSNDAFALTVQSTVMTKEHLDWLVKALTIFRELLPDAAKLDAHEACVVLEALPTPTDAA